ncbi:hypothetical protein HID58_021249 [Brassica napus]|uniref:Flavodoxin-like domain-containing protein n=1 Tax=Brassica napus TaxID=3708 RepID=A0ABQ8CYA3_BRANA|nr:hypothetical protein HID58_021249 [Brassica napus]
MISQFLNQTGLWISVCSVGSSRRYMTLGTTDNCVVECNRYYSMYKHVEKLAQEIRKGAAPGDGVNAKLWQSDAHLITPNDLDEADEFVFCLSKRFGMMAAQFKAFLDETGGLWRTQQLAGKPARIFYSTESQGGGQEAMV